MAGVIFHSFSACPLGLNSKLFVAGGDLYVNSIKKGILL